MSIDPAGEIVVPARLTPMKVVLDLLPDRLERAVRRAIGDDAALRTLHTDARGAYLERVGAQIDSRDS